MMDNVSDEPIVITREAQPTGSNGVNVNLYRGYVPPLDGSDDLVAGFDQQIAKDVASILVQKYFGYEWYVMAESRQGIVAFCIPDLMGPTLKYVIKLGAFADLTPELITRSAGELLERMNLPRSIVDMAAIQFARENKHTFDFANIQGAK
jgi:hypothetical protein